MANEVLLDGDDLAHMEQIVAACVVSREFFVRHVLGVERIEDWQLEVLQALDNGETRISIRSGHGVGKTALCAWLIVHFILFRQGVKIPVTAPSSKQLIDGLIPECHLWLGRLPDFLRAQVNTIEGRIERVDDPENNFVSFRTARADAPEALAGIHADHVMAVVDEASGVPEAVYESAQGTMSTPGAIFILIGNPTRPKGYFFRTHTSMRHKWWTRRVSCMDSTRVDMAFVNEVREMWGVDSNQYRVRVLGEFPGTDKDALIPFELVDAAVGRNILETPNEERVWGVDPGRGGDPSGFVARSTRRVLDLEQWSDPDVMRITGRIKEKWDNCQEHERPSAIYVDTIGLGAGIADRLRELGLPAIDVNVSESSSMKTRYMRLRAELWYTAREWFESRGVSICPRSTQYVQQFIEELTEPEAVFTSSGKNDVESKDSMKARGVPSPNLADAFVMTFAFGGAVLAGRGSTKSNWSQPLDYNPQFVY